MIRHIGEVAVHIDAQRQLLTTVWPDGRFLHAAPEPTPAYHEKARALGYRTAWEMTRDHELLHSLAAVAQGLPSSPVLRAAAEGTPLQTPAAGLEEAVVMSLQAFSNGALWVPEWLRPAIDELRTFR